MFAPRSKPVNEAVEIKRTQEMKEAYNKLIKINRIGTRDTLYLRKVLFNDVRSENLKNCTNSSMQCIAVDNLFSSNEDRMAFRKSSRTPCTDESETLPIFLAMFDAVVTGAAD